MRKFTKTHNDLKWLFPIAKTKAEAEKVFDYVEEQAKGLADIAGIKDEDKDLAIDCYMKGYSYCMQLEIHREVEKAINRIYRNLFNIKPNYDKGEDPKPEGMGQVFPLQPARRPVPSSRMGQQEGGSKAEVSGEPHRKVRV